MKDKKPKDKERWFFKIFKLLELEKTTPHGRTNLAGVLIIAFTLCLLYLCWHEWAKSKISKQQNKDDDD